MASTCEYVSPDGSLRFIVVTEDDGDVALGFAGFPWHTHADLLAACSGVSQTEAVEQFVQDLIGNRAIIVVSSIGGKVRDIWITWDPDSEYQYVSEAESIELRYWDGRRWSAAEQLGR